MSSGWQGTKMPSRLLNPVTFLKVNPSSRRKFFLLIAGTPVVFDACSDFSFSQKHLGHQRKSQKTRVIISCWQKLCVSKSRNELLFYCHGVSISNFGQGEPFVHWCLSHLRFVDYMVSLQLDVMHSQNFIDLINNWNFFPEKIVRQHRSLHTLPVVYEISALHGFYEI